MTEYQLFLFLHIASVIVWVGAGTTLALLWLHPEPTLEQRIRLGEWLGPRLFAPASLGALAFGLVLVHEGHWTFHPFWVQFGLGAFAASLLINAAVRPAFVRRVPGQPQRMARGLAALALFELAILYSTVAAMSLKPTGSDAAFLVPVGVLLAALVVNIFARMQSTPTGTTEG
jgi:hypothetical protein